MIDNFERCFALVLASEGGFVNNPKDPGGATNLGVTQAAWRDWVKRPVSEIEMRELTPEKVSPMYEMRFWAPVKGDQLPLGLDYAMFDFAVNSGPGRAAKTLQEVVGVAPDGALGSRTMAALEAIPVEGLIHDLCESRASFIRSLSTFATFGKGWLARIEKVREAAKAMAAGEK